MDRFCHVLASIVLFCVGRPQAQTPLASWNETASKKAIVTSSRRSPSLARRTSCRYAERIAVFDNDGTLWAEQPMYFQFLFALDRVKALAPQHPEWKGQGALRVAAQGRFESRLLAGGERSSLEIVMATHAGMTTEEFETHRQGLACDGAASQDQAALHRAGVSADAGTARLSSSQRVQDLHRLRAAASSSCVRGVEKVYGIPPEQVVGSSIKTKFEMRDGKPVLVRLPEVDFIDDKEGKPVGINKHIGRRPIAAFGNSDGDLQMLQWTAAGSGARFCLYVHHTDAVREWAYDRTFVHRATRQRAR